MIAKIFFTMPGVTVPVDNQKELNSYIHRSIGHDNEYHDSFSNYAISSLQGGKLTADCRSLYFTSNPFIIISSEDPTFLGKILSGMQFGGEKLFDMAFLRMEIGDYSIHERFDKVVTLSPILIKRDGKKLTIRDEGWLEAVTDNCIQKLKHAGVSTEGFAIELYHPEKSKAKNVYVGEVFNPCTMTGLKITGSKVARKTLYNLGIGNSTGSGFGTIKVYE